MKISEFREAERLRKLPPYLFAEMDRKIAKRRAEGGDVISFAIGDPDFPTPPHVVEAMREAVGDPSTHSYPSYWGLAALREAIGDWMKLRFAVDLDPQSEILPLVGSKEGLAHIAMALLSDGDISLCSDPGYPVYEIASALAGAKPVSVLSEESNGFVPDLSAVKHHDARVLWLNFPGNPTGATCELAFLDEAVQWCRERGTTLVHDNAYSEITFDGYVAPSVLQVPNAKQTAVEFHSFSKTFNMCGWRVGWACGAPHVIEALSRLKTNLDSGVFSATQMACVAALNGPREFLSAQIEVIRRRRDQALETLRDIGLQAQTPRGSFYIWARVPSGFTSASFCDAALEKHSVVLTPGNGYGPNGEGFIRLSLTVPDERLQEGLDRLSQGL